MSKPTISELGARMHVFARRHSEWDEQALRLPTEAERQASQIGREALLDAIIDLEHQILGLPAQTLEDVAVQIAAAFLIVEGSTTEDLEEREDLKRVRFGLISSLGAIAKVAGLDVSRIGWGKWAHLAKGLGFEPGLMS